MTDNYYWYEDYDFNYNNDDVLNEIDKKLLKEYNLRLKEVYFVDGNIKNHTKDNIALRANHYKRKQRN